MKLLSCLMKISRRRVDLSVSFLDGTTSQFKKLPTPVAETLVHYATSAATPILTAAEVGLAARAVARRAPCNLLVFGLGHDSALLAALNHGGRTVFLEDDESWIASVTATHPALESHLVAYDTVVADADALLALRDDPACVAQPDLAAAVRASCRLALALRGLPPAFHEVEWDVILVDAPTMPGRMAPIYAAGMAARARRPAGALAATTDVLVHNVDRPVEDRFSGVFLCDAYTTEEIGKLRQYVVPGRSSDDVPFCPPAEYATADA